MAQLGVVGRAGGSDGVVRLLYSVGVVLCHLLPLPRADFMALQLVTDQLRIGLYVGDGAHAQPRLSTGFTAVSGQPALAVKLILKGLYSCLKKQYRFGSCAAVVSSITLGALPLYVNQFLILVVCRRDGR